MEKLNTNLETPLEMLKQAKRYRLEGKYELGLRKLIVPQTYCEGNLKDHEKILTPFYEEVLLEIGLNYMQGGNPKDAHPYLHKAHTRYLSLGTGSAHEYDLADAYSTLALATCFFFVEMYDWAILINGGALRTLTELFTDSTYSIEATLKAERKLTEKQVIILVLLYMAVSIGIFCIIKDINNINEDNIERRTQLFYDQKIIKEYLTKNHKSMLNIVDKGEGLMIEQFYNLHLFKYSKASKFDHTIIEYNGKFENDGNSKNEGLTNNINNKIKNILNYINQYLK